MALFAPTIFLGAYLLFGVQPLFGKLLLPHFGGGGGVWAVCLAFFQAGLLAGYLWAHLLARLAPRAQVLLHALLLALAAASLSLVPEAALASSAPEGSPIAALFALLLRHAGPPYLAVAATAPLLQHWFSRVPHGRSPYPLYAVSNAGAFVGLLAYPFLLEPSLTRTEQARAWSIGFLGFAALVVACGLVLWRATGRAERDSAERAASGGAAPGAVVAAGLEGAGSAAGRWRAPWLLWLALPACSAALLLATTGQVSEGVAPVPLLWVLPLALHLLSFVVTFRGERAYSRAVLAPLLLVLAALVARDLERPLDAPAEWRIGLYVATLFAACLVCHGELYRLRPVPARLTGYYLAIAAGGAFGGLAVSVLAPLLLDRTLELQFGLAACLALLVLLAWGEAGPRARIALTAPSALLALLLVSQPFRARGEIVHERSRNFYGSLTVVEALVDDPVNHFFALYSGRICHGVQFVHPARHDLPSSYFTPSSGLGIAMYRFIAEPVERRVGVIGLGIGTVAAYAGESGSDRFRFYEIDPDVVRIAEEHFDYLASCPADVEIVVGDARLSLAAEPDQDFELLVVDAFSGDAIPVHLLTLECFRLYLRHLAPDGILAVHVTSSYVDLVPVLARIAQELGLYGVFVETPELVDGGAGTSSKWVLLSRTTDWLQSVIVRRSTRPIWELAEGAPLWTDERAAILDVLY